MKTAIASSTSRGRVSWYLFKSNLGHYFDSVYCGDMVARCKPFPDIYQAAAASIHLSTNECLAIEDSRNGIASAVTAGCITIMIPDITPADKAMRSLCFRVLNSLNDVPEVIAYINAHYSLK
jgi:beta-phosphoglucomutase-like phosphatase (HAD superfamily)